MYSVLMYSELSPLLQGDDTAKTLANFYNEVQQTGGCVQ